MEGLIYLNKKSKKLYKVVSEVIDTTNERDGTLCILYHFIEDSSKLFVREKKEFLEKFILLKDNRYADSVHY